MSHPIPKVMSGLLCLGIFLSASSASADGWKMPKLSPPSPKKIKADTTKALKKIDAGTKRVVRGTVDLLTLRPLWDKEKKSTAPPKPWMHHSSSRNTAPKKQPWWATWSNPKPDPRPRRVEDFIGMKRPE